MLTFAPKNIHTRIPLGAIVRASRLSTILVKAQAYLGQIQEAFQVSLLSCCQVVLKIILGFQVNCVLSLIVAEKVLTPLPKSLVWTNEKVESYVKHFILR